MTHIKKILFSCLFFISGLANASLTITQCTPTCYYDFQGINATAGTSTIIYIPGFGFPILSTTPNTYDFVQYVGGVPMSRIASPTTAGSLLDIQSNLEPLSNISTSPQFLPYYLGNNLNGTVVGTLDVGPLNGPTDEVRLGLVDDSGWLWASVTGTGSFNFNAMPGTNYYGIVYGVVSSPTAYHANISSIPTPSAVWLLGSGIVGLFGVTRKRHARQNSTAYLEWV